MNDFKRQGKTIVVAGHDLALVEHWCDAAVLLEEGRITSDGVPATVVAAYRHSLAKRGVEAREQ
jgi:ABC-type polysaccharide/polyol phosphate transport system ATPase subunit